MVNKIIKWEVRDNMENLSDHYYITYIIINQEYRQKQNTKQKEQKWKINREPDEYT